MKRKIYFVIILLFGMVFLSLPVFGEINIPLYSVEAEPISYPLSFPENKQKLFSDNYYDILTKIPDDWSIRIAFENPDNDNGVINRRIILSNNEDSIIVDIWKLHKSDLESNYMNLEAPFINQNSRKVRNGKINSMDAIVSSNLSTDNGNLPHLSILFQSDKFIYRINYPVKTDIGIKNFLTFLSNFKLKTRQRDSIYLLNNLDLPKKKNIVSFNFNDKVYAATSCGGYTMPAGMNNNFPCCSSGGNCTWWAIYKRQDLRDVITWGNAGSDWITQARQANIPVYDTPVDGSIVVWNPAYDASGNILRSGHVAYVNSHTDSNSFNISEMNCSGSAAPGPRNVDVHKNYSDYWSLPFLGFIGYANGQIVIQNQTISSGTFISNTLIDVLPESHLISSGVDTILRIQ